MEGSQRPFSRRRLNPAAALVDAARDKYEGFQWGRKAKRVKRVKTSPEPRALAKLGTLREITYETKKGREKRAWYTHEFGEEGGQLPDLAVDPETDRLHIVGGGYRVEDRGIVD